MHTSILIALTLAVGCAARSDDADVDVSENAAALADPHQRAFHAKLVGMWHAKTFQQAPDGASAWVDLYWFIGRTHAIHIVTLYADETLQVPLLRWDLIRRYRLEQPSAAFPSAYDLEWTDVASWLTPSVESPALFASVGVDDCALELDHRTDASNNCGAPLFPHRECDMMDFAQIENGTLTFGDPQSTDRCVERANRYERWSFERVPWF